MALFGAMNTAGSGLLLHRTWLDAISDNIANVNTVRPTSENAFQARYVVAQSRGNGTGVDVAGIQLSSAQGRLIHDPSNPMADAQGFVRAPDVDLGEQMTQLIMSQRGYQANLATVERAQAAYQQAIGLGR
ncbi:flagellar basal-body rod protein FlgC [Phycicoccus sp. MAQZ13P-2]|uniref:flagellar basal body rod protein FlgC n=1 Tax=Phycicoccus TaxID=367298 RepID=UPI0004C32D4A|nr:MULTISPECIES: flagellar basal body rod C-terminal domain-containing protein [Phycicoccus]MBT9254937.1 flagellar basal-body rod protein FlgC [Phycicoccus mangrovi]MBT9256066.1 flagellar basal-body rod protein FlgC [Phycicoccus mangrovi]MBT9273921.1 flagellar basal-body rod protein FlgC [Phycicoccus mangrovi]GIL36758.1 flagellar basal-body rod protein FlgC [Phycicoccus sp. DTK01]